MSRARSGEQRWHRARIAFVLGTIAVIALGLIAFVLTTRPVNRTQARPPMLLTPVPSSPRRPPAPPVGRTPSSRPGRTESSTSPVAVVTRRVPRPPRLSRRVAAPPTPPARAVARPPAPATPLQPCRSHAPCAVAGRGQVGAALAAHRRAHGLAAVPTEVTAAAQRCALTGGDGTSCSDPFAVAREQQRSGRAAVRDIGAGTGNFLLDPALRAVDVGWAYLPSARQYVCVLLERV